MAYRVNRVPDLRLVKTPTHQSLTIDLGKEFSGTITAFMKTSYDSDHYREFTVTDGRYISLTQDQTVNLVDGSTTYPIEGRWYFNVWQLAEGASEGEEQLIYTGKILFVGSMSDYEGSSGGTPVTDVTVWFFQYSDTTSDINNIDEITDTFLASNGQEFTGDEMEVGQNITSSNVGRYGFYIPSITTDPPYTIYNELGADITASFDYVYQDGNAYYVSQEIAVPSTVYYLFTEA